MPNLLSVNVGCNDDAGGKGDTWVDARGFLAHEQWEAYQLLKSWKARDAWRLLTSWLTSVASALNSVAPKNTIWHLGYSGNFAIKICVFPVFVGAIITSGFTRLRWIFLDLYSWEQHPSFERKLKMKSSFFTFFIKLPMRIVGVALSRVSLINTLVFFPRPDLRSSWCSRCWKKTTTKPFIYLKRNFTYTLSHCF